MERRLAAILVADVVGYSRLMGDDEEATLDALNAHRTILIDPAVSRHHGRIVKLLGDGALVEFASAVEAVECAVAIQTGMVGRNEDVPEDRRIRFRIGINVGDVMVEADDLYGDCVNIAARLERLAEPGGICISRAARDQVRDRMDLQLEDLNEIEVKNIARPVRVFRIVLDGQASPTNGYSRRVRTRLSQPVTTLFVLVLGLVFGGLVVWQLWFAELQTVANGKIAYPLPDQPSIAVLAFSDLSPSGEDASLAEAVSENIITELSRFRELFVISRNSSFAYKGKPIDIRQVAEELGVRYLIEGSFQKSGTRARITVQLIDALAGNHLWADSYDRQLDDVFKIQDEIASTVASQVSEKVELSERKQAALKSPVNLKAHEYRQLAMKSFLKWTREGNLESRELLLKALDLDPNYARAYAGLAWIYINGYRWGWTELGRPEALELAREYGGKALAIDPFDSFNHRAMAEVHMRSGDLQRALKQFEKGLEVNPNDERTLTGMTDVLVFMGRNQEAVAAMKKAMRLNPHHPTWYNWSLAWAQYYAGQYEEALATFEKMSDPPNKARLVWAATNLRLGREKEARALIAEFRKNEPDYDLAADYKRSKHRNPWNKKRIFEDMQKLFPEVLLPGEATVQDKAN